MIKCISFILFFFCLRVLAFANENYSVDATSLSLEQLVETKFIPASTIANQISNASSAVSVVTSKDIKDYGYRTLGDILASMKGLFVSQDVTYFFLGARGFPSNEYAGRIIVLIDGYRADDSMFGQAYLGNDGILDVSLIERVEYIPGGGSAGYGDGTLLGAINIITKKGSDVDGTQIALGFGSQHAQKMRATVGGELENGVDILVSASSFDVNGRIQQDDDNDEKNKRFFAKVATENLSLMTAYAKRNIHWPTYTYEPIDNSVYADENAFVVLNYHTDITSQLKFSSSLWHGKYTYSGMDHAPTLSYISENKNIAKWYGGDIKLIANWFENHKISLGAGYRHDYSWHSKGFFTDISIDETTNYTIFDTPRRTYSVYAYDDFAITPTLSLNYGFRYEKNNNDAKSIFSPRAALIYKPQEETVLKLSAGVSSRQATPSEGEFVKPENAKTLELVLEQQLGWQTKLTGSIYTYRIGNRISSWSYGDIVAKGAEIELEKHWLEGSRLRASYAWQNAKETDGVELEKSPSHIAKLNLSTPLIGNRLRLGMEAQYISKYLPYVGLGEYHKDYVIFNVNLLAHRIMPNLEIQLLAHDVFNKSDEDEYTLLPQSGRAFWLQMEYTFK